VASVDIAGGASAAVRQALTAAAITELVLDVASVLLGDGERLFDSVTDPDLSRPRSFPRSSRRTPATVPAG
jgi:dihydrofolate reductase